MTDHEVSPEGRAFRGCLAGIVGIVLFFGCVLGYAWYTERPDPLPDNSVPPATAKP